MYYTEFKVLYKEVGICLCNKSLMKRSCLLLEPDLSSVTLCLGWQVWVLGGFMIYISEFWEGCIPQRVCLIALTQGLLSAACSLCYWLLSHQPWSCNIPHLLSPFVLLAEKPELDINPEEQIYVYKNCIIIILKSTKKHLPGSLILSLYLVLEHTCTNTRLCLDS